MKLLFVADRHSCGAARRHLVTLSSAMALRGHEVVVACLNDNAELAAQFALTEQIEQGRAVRLVCCAAPGRLAALIDTERPHLMVAASPTAQMLATLARRRAARRPALAFICHSMDMLQPGAVARLRWMVYRLFCRQAECVVFVSTVQRDLFAAQGLGVQGAVVIHNGVDLRHFSPDQVACTVPVLRARYGLTRADLVIGCCAAFREPKRHVDLLQAMARLRALGLPVKAVLVGDGPLRPAIAAAVERLHLRGSVIMPGFQHDVRPFIGMCDVMALTSHTETFPSATLESMALGKPVVASAVGGMGEQVIEGCNGLLYRAGDVDALTAALARMANPALRQRLGQGALTLVSARFSQRSMLARYEALFKNLAQAHAPFARAPV